MDTSGQNAINITEHLSQNHDVFASDMAALSMGLFGSALVIILSFISSILHF